MRAGFTCLALVSLASGSVYGQMQDNPDNQMSCDHDRGRSDQARHCEIREPSFAGPGRLNVDGGVNGGANVKGWLRNDVLVRAKIDAWADTDGEASLLAGQVHVDTAGGQIRASGPESAHHSGWSVSYEIFVPQTTDLNLKTHNGGISISDVRGRIEFDAT